MTKDPNELNLVPAIKEVEAQIRKIKAEYEKKLQPYTSSLEQLRRINTACERCGGLGKVLRPRACAEDDIPDPNDPRDWNKCDECGGTGLAHDSRCENKEAFMPSRSIDRREQCFA